MKTLSFGPLRSRKTPQQQRAVQRVNVILQATAECLADGVLLDLSTTTIAKRAGIPVSSIYRYFPTLDALLLELYLQTASELREALFAIFADQDLFPAWRDRLGAVLSMQRDYLARHPYYRPLLMRFVTNRGPVAVEDEDHEELYSFLRSRWAAGGDGFHAGDPTVVANTTVQIALAMEDLIAAQTDRDASRPYSAELSVILEGYLANYLRDD
jgi:AcrR family transcriptional regulator